MLANDRKKILDSYLLDIYFQLSEKYCVILLRFIKERDFFIKLQISNKLEILKKNPLSSKNFDIIFWKTRLESPKARKMLVSTHHYRKVY